jgi:hypothetical protein
LIYNIWPIGDQPTTDDKAPQRVDGWQPQSGCLADNKVVVSDRGARSGRD